MRASDRLDEIMEDGYDSVADYRGKLHRAAAFIDGLEVIVEAHIPNHMI